VPSAFSRSTHPRFRALCALAAVTVACLWAAPAALADSVGSGNWAGYAAHRSGVRFRSVSGRWMVPRGSCNSGQPGFSSIWVGLGGYSGKSNALEQTGTELDCTRSGQAIFSAWYELVPAAAHTVSLGVRGGDLMQAAVTVTGHRVTIALQDLTDHRAFRRTVEDSDLDTTSADWIVEAPAGCNPAGNCFTLPLADFGTATISSASAVTQSGHRASVTSRWWGTTKITLSPHATRSFVTTVPNAGAKATPSALSAGGSAFSVIFERTSASTGQTGSGGPYVAGPLVHPRR
jgi:hypothetical protein